MEFDPKSIKSNVLFTDDNISEMYKAWDNYIHSVLVPEVDTTGMAC